MKRLLRVTFRVLAETSKENHPREYLTEFKSLEVGNYPLFTDYPKNVVDLQLEEERRIEDELETVVMSRLELGRLQQDETVEKTMQEEQNRRVKAIEEKCLEKLRSRQELVEKEREKIEKIKQLLPMYQRRNSPDQNEEKSTSQFYNFSEVEEIFRNRNSNQEGSSIYNQIMQPDQVASTSERTYEEFSGVKEQYLSRLKKLLEYKLKINEILDRHRGPISEEERQAKVEGQIKKIRSNLKSTRSLKKLNISTSIHLLENLIGKIENELRNVEGSEKDLSRSKKMKNLQKETKGLEKEVAKLLELVSKDFRIQPHLHEENCNCNCSEWCEKRVRFSPSSSEKYNNV
ncbi:unnamed protein product [Callosobruchus maculatus]|nr:unnamed protein product [Callosobruchus maculatus]